jgi:hypothetical protein
MTSIVADAIKRIAADMPDTVFFDLGRLRVTARHPPDT